ncbi:hypothetical protein DO97_06570 [Neosynechococcus sphagnicola sy1]|uniref:Uncharacterized protein n=1 Tax=Neosynechococcus sphagnicola sy1 TaxID=1497020 RepID=A0A098TK53_9CYAN|nr:hypothetical protein [Neosynechococcus sphagnicola]KGF72684.1 hypothetical protein DO97_06570 [Neosynechococcus sphagnicola sy1]
MLTISIWHHYLIFGSFAAAIAGILLLFLPKLTHTPEPLEATEWILLLMSFAYWSVYCSATLLQPLCLSDWDILRLSLKITAIITYFLTVACILSLPLHRLAMSRQVEE